MDNQEPVYVTEIKERKGAWPWRAVRVYNVYNCAGKKVIYNSWEDFPALLNLTAHHTKKAKADELFLEFYNLGPHPNFKEAKRIVDELVRICEIPYEKKTDLEKWAHSAVQMPGDIGGPRKEDVKEFITSRARGKVLEAMCGFNSYFAEAENISEVVALDFCKEMLERYEFPKRKRILFDLEKITNEKKLAFFKNEEFNTIGCWGSNYLKNPVLVFAEFYRILSKHGKFLIHESTSEGYPDQIKRYFNPQECSEFMQQAGFSTSIEPLPWLKSDGEIGEHYLVEGIK